MKIRGIKGHKMVFRIITMILIQVFLVIEVGWTGEILSTQKQLSRSNLSPSLSMGGDLLKGVFESISRKGLSHLWPGVGPNLATAYFYTEGAHDVSNDFLREKVYNSRNTIIIDGLDGRCENLPKGAERLGWYEKRLEDVMEEIANTTKEKTLDDIKDDFKKATIYIADIDTPYLFQVVKDGKQERLYLHCGAGGRDESGKWRKKRNIFLTRYLLENNSIETLAEAFKGEISGAKKRQRYYERNPDVDSFDPLYMVDYEKGVQGRLIKKIETELAVRNCIDKNFAAMDVKVTSVNVEDLAAPSLDKEEGDVEGSLELIIPQLAMLLNNDDNILKWRGENGNPFLRYPLGKASTETFLKYLDRSRFKANIKAAIEPRDKRAVTLPTGQRENKDAGLDVDLAGDLIEYTNALLKNTPGAMSIVVFTPKGNIRELPDLRMEKIFIGSKPEAEGIDLRNPLNKNLGTSAQNLGKSVKDLKTSTLFRWSNSPALALFKQVGITPEDYDQLKAGLKKEIPGLYKSNGLTVLQGGDILPALAVSKIKGLQETLDIHLGKGRALEGILAAGLSRALKGWMQARMLPEAVFKRIDNAQMKMEILPEYNGLYTLEERESLEQSGIKPGQIFNAEDIVKGEDIAVIMIALTDSPWFDDLSGVKVNAKTGEISVNLLRITMNGGAQKINIVAKTLISKLLKEIEAKKDKTKADDYYNLAQAYADYGLYKDAISYIDKANDIEQKSKYKNAGLFYKGMQMLVKGKNIHSIEDKKMFEMFDKVNTEQADKILRDLYLYLGDWSFQDMSFETAQNYYQKAINLFPDENDKESEISRDKISSYTTIQRKINGLDADSAKEDLTKKLDWLYNRYIDRKVNTDKQISVFIIHGLLSKASIPEVKQLIEKISKHSDREIRKDLLEDLERIVGSARLAEVVPLVEQMQGDTDKEICKLASKVNGMFILINNVDSAKHTLTNAEVSFGFINRIEASIDKLTEEDDSKKDQVKEILAEIKKYTAELKIEVDSFVHWYTFFTEAEEFGTKDLKSRQILLESMFQNLLTRIKQPLNALETVINLLKADDNKLIERSNSKAYVDTMVKEIERIKNLWGSLEKYIKEPQPKIQPVNIKEILASVIDEVEQQAQDKEVKLLLEDETREDVPIYALIDRKQIKESLKEVVINAIKSNGKGMDVGLRLEVKDNTLVLKVVDKGKGIEKARLAGIYNPLKYLEFKPEKIQEGFHLPLIYKIFVMNNGSLRVESSVEKPKGTTVTMSLPVLPVEDVRVGLSKEDFLEQIKKENLDFELLSCCPSIPSKIPHMSAPDLWQFKVKLRVRFNKWVSWEELKELGLFIPQLRYAEGDDWKISPEREEANMEFAGVEDDGKTLVYTGKIACPIPEGQDKQTYKFVARAKFAGGKWKDAHEQWTFAEIEAISPAVWFYQRYEESLKVLSLSTEEIKSRLDSMDPNTIALLFSNPGFIEKYGKEFWELWRIEEGQFKSLMRQKVMGEMITLFKRYGSLELPKMFIQSFLSGYMIEGKLLNKEEEMRDMPEEMIKKEWERILTPFLKEDRKTPDVIDLQNISMFIEQAI